MINTKTLMDLSIVRYLQCGLPIIRARGSFQERRINRCRNFLFARLVKMKPLEISGGWKADQMFGRTQPELRLRGVA